MKRRFSPQHLYQLRNFISIDLLIEKELLIPCKQSEGFFRFLCPLCGEFQTATMKKTNLARCFRCGKNFNTIDMVMLCRNTDFVQSVRVLTAYLKDSTGKTLHHEPVGIEKIPGKLTLKGRQVVTTNGHR